MDQSEPTISSILLELADEYNGIVTEREVFERVLARRPSQAKDPYASIRNKLRYDAIETGCDESLQRGRDFDRRDRGVRDPPAVALLDPPALHEHSQELLDVQRIALGPRDDVAADLLRQVIDRQERRDEPPRVVRAQRRERDRRRIRGRASPRGPQLAKVGPCKAQQEERRARPLGQVLDEIEKSRLGPVHVLEDQHQRR